MKDTLSILHPWVRSGWAITLTLGLSGALAAQQPSTQVTAPQETGTQATGAQATGAAGAAAENATDDTEATPSVAGESAVIGTATPEVYLLRDRGYQSWLRKYEGQRERDRPFSLGTLNAAGYARSLQYFIEGNDVFSRNTVLGAEIGLTDKVWLRASTTGITRRIAVPYANLVPTADVLSLTSTPPAAGQPGTLLALLPPFVMAPARLPFDPVVPLGGITPTSEFGIDRTNNSAKLSLKPFKSDKVEFFGDLWTSKQEGSRPLIFRSRRSASPTAVTGGVSTPGFSGIKFLTMEPVDSTTFDSGIGLNAAVGPGSVSYRLSRVQYENSVRGPFLPAGFPPSPTSPAERISDSRYNDTSANNHDAKIAMPLGKDFSLNGTWIRRNRTHETAGLLLLDNNAVGTPPGVTNPILLTQNVKSRLDTKTASLRYSGVDNLLLTARLRAFDLDRNAPLVVSGAVPAIQNQSVSRKEKEGELEASYSGISSTLIRASYGRINTDRAIRAVHEPVDAGHEPGPDNEWEHAAIAVKSDGNIWRLGATTYLLPNTTLRANWKRSDIKHSVFHGTPSDSDDLSLGLSYTPREDIGFFADFRRLDEKNKLIGAPGFLTLADPLVGGDPALYTEIRESQAGAQYSNKQDTVVLGFYKTIGTKLTLDTNLTHDKTRSQNYWVLGIDPNFGPHPGGVGDPTGEGPELVPYNAKNNSVSAGLTYAATPKLSLRSNLLYGRSNGQTTSLSLFRLVPPAQNPTPTGEWQAFDTRVWRLGLGASYRTTDTQQILVELSFNKWKDKIETAYNGNYALLTLGWKTEF